MQSDWLKKRCRRLVGNNALLKMLWMIYVYYENFITVNLSQSDGLYSKNLALASDQITAQVDSDLWKSQRESFQCVPSSHDRDNPKDRQSNVSEILRTSELCETLTKSRLFFFNPEFKEDTSLVLR
mgnify:CR=1 FL=1